MQSWSFWLEN
jgi:hypothetical protein